MSNYLAINDYMVTVEQVSFKRGKEFESDGSTNYAYAYGFSLSTLKYTLDELNLTPKQIEILNKRAEWLRNG